MHDPCPNPNAANVPQCRAANAGFTLMELAIAVAVVLIGVLALFALISSGLDSSSLAVADTQSAIFAESVFNGIGAASQSEAEKGAALNGDIYWRKFWAQFAAGTTNILVPATNVWTSAKITSVIRRPFVVYGDGLIRTNVYEAVRQHPFSTVSGIVHTALRYRLEIEPAIPNTTTGYQDPANTVQRVTLHVWGGEFGSQENKDALVFYSEFDNPGDL